MIIEVAKILIAAGLLLFGIAAIVKWIGILIDCFTLGDWLEGIFFTGIGLFFIGIVIALVFGNIL